MTESTPAPVPVKETTYPNASDVQSALAVMTKWARGIGAFHFNACLRCGLCSDSCHIYRGEPDMANIPAQKASKVASLFRRHFTISGKLFPGLVGARNLTAEALNELPELVYGRCTACGRCSFHCPVGVDLRDLMRAGRQICAATGRVPQGLQRTVDNQLETGNQMAIPRAELLSTAEWLAEDVKLELGDDTVRIPVDEKGKRILYLINPREVKFFPLSLMAAAGVFHTAGESWTLSSRFFDVTNYGFYSGDDESAAELTRRVIGEATDLGVKEIVLSECGHGYRSFRWEGPNWLGHEYPIPVRSILELLDEYLEAGRLKVAPEKNDERVTLHDPCNLVRWGGVIEPQRRILRRVVRDFVEMTPNRDYNFCCGGGGGMLSMSEYGDRRVASGKTKADQIRATGAKIVATPCHNCADQLIELSKRYELGVDIQAIVELVYSALA
ncbi:MAG: (Fe-S)-binding protein [Planctomycetes bacterium]|nr:(Fe-S)-binding protein [Planctomycetota bacterium]